MSGSQLPSCPFPVTLSHTQQVDSDEEARQAEEEEVLALQAAQAAGLQDDDFGLHSFAPEPDATQQQGTGAGRVTAAAAEVETVSVDMEGLTAGRCGGQSCGVTVGLAEETPPAHTARVGFAALC